MATLYITEYAGSGNTSQGSVVGQEPEITTQALAYTGTAAASSAFANNTAIVRLQSDGICSVFFSTAGTAATTSKRRMTAGQTEWFTVPVAKGYKVSAIVNT